MDKNDYGILHWAECWIYKKDSSAVNVIMCLFLFDVFDGIVFWL